MQFIHGIRKSATTEWTVSERLPTDPSQMLRSVTVEGSSQVGVRNSVFTLCFEIIPWLQRAMPSESWLERGKDRMESKATDVCYGWRQERAMEMTARLAHLDTKVDGKNCDGLVNHKRGGNDRDKSTAVSHREEAQSDRGRESLQTAWQKVPLEDKKRLCAWALGNRVLGPPADGHYCCVCQ